MFKNWNAQDFFSKVIMYGLLIGVGHNIFVSCEADKLYRQTHHGLSSTDYNTVLWLNGCVESEYEADSTDGTLTIVENPHPRNDVICDNF